MTYKNTNRLVVRFALVALLLACFGGPPVEAQLARDGMIIDSTATRLNPNAGKPIYNYALHNLTLSPAGDLLAAGQGTGKVLIWDLESGKLKHEFKAHEDWTFSIQFSSDASRLVTGGGDNKVRIWNLANLESPELDLERHTGDVHSVMFSKDEKKIYSSGDDMIPIVANIQHDSYQVWTKHPRQIPAMALSEDGERLVTASRDGKVRIFSTADGELLHTLDAHTKDCITVRFIPDSDQIVTGGYDNTVAVWDIGMGYLVKRFNKQEGAVVCVDASPDGQQVASVDHKTIAMNSLGDAGKPTEYLSPELASDEQLSFVRFHPNKDLLYVTTTLARILIVDSKDLRLVKTITAPQRETSQDNSENDNS